VEQGGERDESAEESNAVRHAEEPRSGLDRRGG
jgi:hypothetical protein